MYEIREREIDGVNLTWTWLKTDQGAWGGKTDGPAFEFTAIRKAILEYTKQTKVIIQAGGCMGMYPRLWSNYFDKVITAEPDLINFYCLEQNCSEDRITKIKGAFGSSIDKLTFEQSNYENAGTGRITGQVEGKKVDIYTIDSLQLDCVDAIQLDVERYETEVLRGAIKTIDQ